MAPKLNVRVPEDVFISLRVVNRLFDETRTVSSWVNPVMVACPGSAALLLMIEANTRHPAVGVMEAVVKLVASTAEVPLVSALTVIAA